MLILKGDEYFLMEKGKKDFLIHMFPLGSSMRQSSNS